MKIETIGRNIPIDDRLREHAEEKLHRFGKFLEEPAEARLTLTEEKHHHVAELHVSHRGGVLQAVEKTEGNLREAVDRVLDKVEEQARRAHEKQVDRRRRADHRSNGHRWPVEVLEPESVRGGEVPRIIETSHLPIKPMTIEEAALELEVSEHGFVVFRDAASDRLSVLYKRKDHNYGLIAPEL